jgi:hypothetical protein|tara:strand:- start:1593 stop:2480 length:888 start_codon:yes stop_codon:yes gene_type:complete
MTFADLKRKSQANFDFLQKEIEKSTQTGGGKDERFWRPELDNTGNGYAVIRFLPPPEGEDLPWAKLYSHAFQGPGGWYIENSLTTQNKKDPVGEVNRKLWNSGHESDKDIARKQKRKLTYYTNIVVVKDPKNPENEGKVFLYKFGKKIFDKVMAAMQPEFQDETPVNVFDFWEGANFKLKIKTVAGFWNYDSSEFDAVSALSSDDSQLETTYKEQHSLAAFTAEDQFKTYEELETRLNAVLNSSPSPAAFRAQAEEQFEPVPVEQVAASSAPKFNKKETSDDDALSYFASLAEED